MWKKSMPTTQDSPNVQDALNALRPTPEQHHVDPDAHCIIPKCGYYFSPQDEQEMSNNGGWFTCPQCGTEHDYYDGAMRGMGFAPGGTTRASLTLDEMGNIGEQVVFGMGEIPGVGRILPTGTDMRTSAAAFPIDCIIEGEDGNRYGVEIKTNHSQAQPRFKLGGQAERHAKINYCMSNGLKPALMGVRLNFFDDLADIFFRPGLTDTWIGNKQMQHVAQVSFANLNPFKTPEQHQELLQNPPVDQSTADDDWNAQMDKMFGPEPPKDDAVYGGWRRTAEDEPDPDYIFVYYMSQLKIEPWHHNRTQSDMFEDMLAEQGTNIQGYGNEFDSTDVATGVIYKESGDSIRVEQEGFVKPDVDLLSRMAIRNWMNEGGDTTKDEDSDE